MAYKTIRLKFRRIVRRRKKEAVEAAEQAEEQLDKLFFRRLARLSNVRRFVFGWVSLLLLLIVSVGLQARGLGTYYQMIAPVDGGTMREGIIGTFTNANPLYAISSADASVSKLLFSSLYTHDANNQLVPDLAEKWESDDKGQVYKVSLHQNIKWHDGVAFTADDVVFTYQTIQKADAKSPLFSSWQGVEIKALDNFTVEFTLPSPLASFPYSLTNGIVPRHILGEVPVSQLRSVPFNTSSPIGTGPFKWKSVEVSGSDKDKRSEQIALSAYDGYHFGRPKIDQYVLKTFRKEEDMVSAYDKQELTAITGLDKLPNELNNDPTTNAYNIPTDGAVMVFLNNSSEILQDPKVRQALTAGTDRAELLTHLGFPVLTVDSPLLKQQPGYDKTVTQRAYSITEASKLLDEAGWLPDGNGLRHKGDKPLLLRFVSQNIAEYTAISQSIQKQWRSIGVELDVKLRPEEEMQGDILTRHDYDVLLYGITMGVDPDVFAYWHSSQADVRATSRLNLSEYKNKNADKALEAGRTRLDAALRSVKYKPFLVAWRDDAPAIALYQPRYLYIARSQLIGMNARKVNDATDRLFNVQNWTVTQDKVLK